MTEIALQSAVLPDEELVIRILEGEKYLFEILVLRHSKRLRKVVLSVLRNDAEADDAVQDAFLSAFEHLAQFKGRAKFATWLSRIALYRAFALAAKSDRCVSLDEEFEDETPVRVAHDPRPSPEQQAYFNQLTCLLSTAVEDLPERYRSVFIMREVEEVDTEETARRLRLSRTNVKVRLHRARAMIRAHYEQSLACGIVPPQPASGILAAVI